MQQGSATLLDRRALLRGIVATLVARGLGDSRADAATGTSSAELRRIEQHARGRLGAYVLDTPSNTGFGWREDKRFAHCSSFKLSLAAMVLRMADRGEVDPREPLHWTPKEVLPVRPVAAANVGRGLSVEELARAALIITAYFEPAHLVEPMDPVSVRVLAQVGRVAAESLSTAGCGSVLDPEVRAANACAFD